MPDEFEQSVVAADQQNLSAGAIYTASFALRSLIAAFILAASVLVQLNGASAGTREAGAFDYYALTLSWSPTYCAEAGNKLDSPQCDIGRRFAFVVHGLWPQYERGWPENCAPHVWVPENDVTAALDIMPSRALVIHEWKRHGSCAGMTPHEYFALTRKLFEKIRIPLPYSAPESDLRISPGKLVSDLVDINEGLSADMISVGCGNRRDTARLSELRICFDREGAFRACGDNETRQCRAATLVLPRVR
jgi:ribonuclease T2